MKPTNIPSNSIKENFLNELNRSYKEYSMLCPVMNDNYQIETSIIQIKNSIEPSSGRIWVHLSCLFWSLGKIYFKTNKQVVSSLLKSLNKEKFSSKCCICNLMGNGCCLRCSRQLCPKTYHIECLRLYITDNNIN